MKYQWQRINDAILLLTVIATTSPAFADLPTPPQKDLANSTNDWGDVGGAIAFRILGYAFIVMGAVILMGIAGNIYKAYITAHEKQDLGHFFKHLVVGLVCAALAMGLVYAGYQILPTQNN